LEFGVPQLEILAVFLAVYALIVVRRIGRFKVEVWMAMLLGAVALLSLGAVSLGEALMAINSQVILFLIGSFLIVGVMAQTGLLQAVAVAVLRRARTPSRLLLFVIAFVSVASAFLVNDAVVLVVTPIVIASCTIAGLKKTPYIIAVALSSNIGSALTPIGNPQNVLIKIESGISTLGFMGKMAIPVVLAVAAEYVVLKAIYRKEMSRGTVLEIPERGPDLMGKAEWRMLIAITVGVMIGFITSDLTGVPIAIVALVGGTMALLLSPDRRESLKRIDWGTMVFFASMFVVMHSVEASGLLGFIIDPFRSWLFVGGVGSVAAIFGLSIALSQLTSNVPFVAMMLPIFRSAGASPDQWLSLAAGSTLGGNLTLLGAAANVIVLEAAECKGESFSFIEFMKGGVPVTIISSAIAIAVLSLLLGI